MAFESKYPPPPGQQSYSAPTTPAEDSQQDAFAGDDQSWNLQSASAPQTPQELQNYQHTREQAVPLETSPHTVPSQMEPNPAGHDLAPVRLHHVEALSPDNSYSPLAPETLGHVPSTRTPVQSSSLVIPGRPATALQEQGAMTTAALDSGIRYHAVSAADPGPSSSTLRQSSMKQSHRVAPYSRPATGAIELSAASSSVGTGTKSSFPRLQQRQRKPSTPASPVVQYRFRHEYSGSAAPGTSAQAIATGAANQSSSSPVASQHYSPPQAPSTPSPQVFQAQTDPTPNVLNPTSAAMIPTPNPPPALPSLPRMMITMDMHYDSNTQILTAMLELPGVRPQDVTVTLSTSIYNCVRQVRVHGRTHPVFPPVFATSEGVSRPPHTSGNGWTICRERRFGEFSRIFPVHPLVTLDDIDATIRDGILTLRMRCGPPASSTDEVVIPIRGS